MYFFIFRLHMCLGLETDGYSTESQPSPKKIHQVSQSDNPTKITIKTTTLESVPNERPSRKRKTKEFASPNSEARIHVDADNEFEKKKDSTSSGAGPSNSEKHGASNNDGLEKCSVTIQFDLNT